MRRAEAEKLARTKHPNAMADVAEDGRGWVIIAEGKIVASGSTCECAWIDLAIQVRRNP